MIYTMPSEEVGLEVLEALSRRYPTKHDEQPAQSLVYYDTFDWRLHRAGGLFTGTPSPRGFRLAWTRGGAGRSHRLEVDAVPAFAWDFPAGTVRDEIAPILSMRRLLPIVEVGHRSRTVHVTDDEAKTVVRVVLREATARRPDEEPRPLPTTLRTVALRGYGREHRELVQVLETEIGLVPSGEDDFTTALAAVGREAGDYTSKLRLHLEPARPSSEAAVEIFRSLLETLLANEDGTRRDLDSEFLHDFRVSVRRTRSALSQLGQVLPQRVADHYRGEFKWLGNATGPTRDLDVYLLKIDGYEASLPESIRADLEPLRRFLERRQHLEQERLVGVLDSKRYRELVEGWRRFLAEPVKSSSAANAAHPVGELASERVRKAFRRVWKKGGAIGPESPAEALHGLRIDCKKLRYLLEFFRSLYPSSEIDPLVKALKQLQDNLGDFNDLEVQQEKLRDFARQMVEEGEVAPATLLAMGELVAGLRRFQEEERLAFAEHFGRFSEHRRAFRRLFAGGKPL